LHTFIKKCSIPLAVMLLLAVVLSACGSPATPLAPKPTPPPATQVPAPSPPVNLNGAGATFPAPLYTKWFDEYYKITGAKINYQAIGSGGGITQITEGTVDFGATDGIMTADQLTKAEATRGPILHIPMTSGPVVVVYNVPGISTGQIKLAGDVVADIYLKKITKWNDSRITALNSGLSLPDAAIGVVYRSDGSGTTNIFTNYLAKVSNEWSTQIGTANSVKFPGDIGGQGNAGVAGQVQQVPNTIGYVELAYALQNKIAFAQLKNLSGAYITPSMASASKSAEGVTLPDDMKIMITDSSNPDAYSIVGFTWILAYVNQTDKAKGESLVKLLWWAIHDGQKLNEALNYPSLPGSAVTKAENQTKSINYQGKSLLSR
jgi:phosphate transport system substrate-binding protein